MQIIKKLWNTSPKNVYAALMNRLSPTKIQPSWTGVEAGPFKGGQLYIDAQSFSGWKDMIHGRFDSFIYEELKTERALDGAVFWDIGAHFGYHTFSFASLVGDKGHVFSFEPNPFNATRFKMHLDKNPQQAKRITLVPVALSDTDGEVRFVFSDDVDGSSSSGSHLVDAKVPLSAETYVSFKNIDVETAKIDTFLKRPGIKAPDVMKIDVEGAEMLVLRGATEFFKTHKPIIFMEVHNISLMHQVQNFLVDQGYALKLLDESNSTLSKCFIKARPV